MTIQGIEMLNLNQPYIVILVGRYKGKRIGGKIQRKGKTCRWRSQENRGP